MIMGRLEVTGLHRIIHKFEGISKALPKANDRDLWNSAQNLGKEFRDGMKKAGITNVSHKLYASTFPKKTGKSQYMIGMEYYGAMLSQMPPHVVSLRGKPDLQAEFQKKFGVSKASGYIFVRPHEFYDSSLARFAKRFRGELENGNTIKLFRR